MTRRRLIIVQIMIWSVAIIYNVPYLVFYDTIEFPVIDIQFCYFKEESLAGLKGLSVANIIVWYVIPLGMIGLLYYIIGRALWNTAVVSALPLQSFGDSKNSSIRSAKSHRASRVNSASTYCPDDIPATQKDHQESNGSNDDVVSYSMHEGHWLYMRRAKWFSFSTKTQMFYQRFTYEKQHSVWWTDNSARDDVYDDKLRTVSYKKPSIRYRQTHIESSRKVARSRKKVNCLLAAFVITFSFCVLPHHVKVLNHYWNIYTLPHEIDVYISPIAAMVLYLNSALNPILYALFSNKFRQSFTETLPCFRRKTKKASSFRLICS